MLSKAKLGKFRLSLTAELNTAKNLNYLINLGYIRLQRNGKEQLMTCFISFLKIFHKQLGM